MRPFADDEASQAIGELTVENGTNRIAIYGQLEVARDKAGLKRARQLKAILDGIVEVLEADKELPTTVADDTQAPVQVKNPFA